jgi:hypothetical protein
MRLKGYTAMFEKISHSIQIVSGIVLIVGVVLVLEELNQTKRLAQAQLESDSWDGIIGRGIAQMGEAAPRAMAKACTGEELSNEDAIVLISRFQVALSHVAREREVERLAGFESERWKLRARASFGIVFATEEGRSWWDSMRETYTTFIPEMVSLGDSILLSMGPPDCGLDAVLEPDA